MKFNGVSRNCICHGILQLVAYNYASTRENDERRDSRAYRLQTSIKLRSRKGDSNQISICTIYHINLNRTLIRTAAAVEREDKSID